MTELIALSVLVMPAPCTLQPQLDPKLIGQRATAKWVREFKYIRASATGQLARFMDYVA
jgi:hypothetical protein